MLPTIAIYPCILARYVFVANYMGGTAAAIPIEADGKLGEVSKPPKKKGKKVLKVEKLDSERGI